MIWAPPKNPRGAFNCDVMFAEIAAILVKVHFLSDGTSVWYPVYAISGCDCLACGASGFAMPQVAYTEQILTVGPTVK